MFEPSTEDLSLSTRHDEEMVNNLLYSDDSDGDEGGSVSITKSQLPLTELAPCVFPSVISTRYKTEVCTSYASTGWCRYAERCQFAHGLSELRLPSYHPKYKTELCRNYHNTGYCDYGSRCLFVHNPTEQRPVKRRRRNIPCRTYSTSGFCLFGNHCKFMHIDGGSVGISPESPDNGANIPPGSSQVQTRTMEQKPQRTLCHTFSTFGFCLYGTRCHFQHVPNRNQRRASYPWASPGSSGTFSPLTPSSFSSPNSESFSSPLTTPPADTTTPNTFTFSSQLGDLLLPLCFHLKQLDGTNPDNIGNSRAM
ncbi:mRNA decay activator protein ZFP36L2-like isoform X2 [Thalassophryne amazonica]|uniref:mRNA decay activator protein ZFP36L2-like isoform X2 n=1 Tax=Thalassophryne amazonica TaxID=390379 RepID=UPI0014718D26|nr:mRNA decay activator protein ZFP36L2-like isoform X2 [Thalassophryne amazonica]